MSRNICEAVDHDMLYRKSSDYIKRALEAKKAGDISMHWLLSSVALELLGKAVLATRDPFDITVPRYYEAILVEAGAEARTGVKTIGARIVYEKLEEIVPGFNKEVMNFCIDIAALRNAELHSGESPFENMRADDWKERYWGACDIILEHVSLSKEHWLEAEEMFPVPIFFGSVNAIATTAVALKVDEAKMNFRSKKRTDQEQFSDDSNLDLQSVSRMLKEKYDEIWDCTCPACESTAFVAGDQADHLAVEETSYPMRGLAELSKTSFFAEEFICPACGLALSSGEEVYHAIKSGYHYEKYEKSEVT